MAKTGATEREFAGKVNAWIMAQIEHGSCPFQNATIDSSLYGSETTLFPDVLVTLDEACILLPIEFSRFYTAGM